MRHRKHPALIPCATLSTSHSQRSIQRGATCACGGGCPRCQGQSLHSTLKISAPSDPFEREADRVADAVAGGAAGAITLDTSRTLGLSRSVKDGEAGEFAPAMVDEVLRAPGQPLDASTSALFEPRFGRSFSDVRIHASGLAAESASAVGAAAYTVGNDVVFGAGRYAPNTAAGDHLLAHELTHVVHQQGTIGLQRRVLQRQSAGAQHTLAFSEQPLDLQSVFANTLKENSSEKEPLVCMGQSDVASCFNRLSARDRATIVGIYQRMGRFGLWPHVHHFRKVWYNVVGGVEMTVTDHLKLFEGLLNSPFFCIDKPEGALLHPGATSIREISSIDSLHLSIGSLNRVTAHLDAISPTKCREPGGYCQYDPIQSQAHIGREVVPLFVPKFQIFPEQPPVFGPPGQQQSAPPIVGFEFRF